jgi:hypothetical protein
MITILMRLYLIFKKTNWINTLFLIFEDSKVKNITANAYIRDPKEYNSDMEVNHA